MNGTRRIKKIGREIDIGIERWGEENGGKGKGGRVIEISQIVFGFSRKIERNEKNTLIR